MRERRLQACSLLTAGLTIEEISRQIEAKPEAVRNWTKHISKQVSDAHEVNVALFEENDTLFRYANTCAEKTRTLEQQLELLINMLGLPPEAEWIDIECAITELISDNIRLRHRFLMISLSSKSAPHGLWCRSILQKKEGGAVGACNCWKSEITKGAERHTLEAE